MSGKFCVNLGKKIREFRTKRGMSQEVLGTKAGISGSFVGMIERAEKDVSLSNVVKIAKALKINLKELF